MIRFVKKTIVFAVVCYVLLLVLDILISNKLKPNMPSNNSDLVLLGSSRCQEHFDTNIISDSLGLSAFNIGLRGSKIDIHYMLLKEYLDFVPSKPQYLTYVFDIHDNNFSNNTIYRHYQFFPLLLYNLNYYNVLKTYAGFDNYLFFVPMFRYSGYIKVMYGGFDYFLYRGYYNINSHGLKDKDYVCLLDQDSINYAYTYDSTTVVCYLEKIINLCKINNIQLNLVYAPEYYICRNVKNRDKVFSLYRLIALKNNIPLEDFSVDSSLNANNSYFSDILHLNRKGAEVFTSSYYVPYMKNLIKNCE